MSASWGFGKVIIHGQVDPAGASTSTPSGDNKNASGALTAFTNHKIDWIRHRRKQHQIQLLGEFVELFQRQRAHLMLNVQGQDVTRNA